jgi:myo-inositol 2-dehydrogenase / D-chiro-inositol 1-dehydrogenase
MRDYVALAVIGCGDVAMTRHLSAFIADRNVRLVTVCDTNSARVERAWSAFNATHCTTDVADILTDDTIDAVIIATPPWVTPHLTIAVLASGKDVLCEEPMALSLEEA